MLFSTTDHLFWGTIYGNPHVGWTVLSVAHQFRPIVTTPPSASEASFQLQGGDAFSEAQGLSPCRGFWAFCASESHQKKGNPKQIPHSWCIYL